MPLVGFDQDPLERLEVGVLAEEVHPADRSVQDVVDQPAGCVSRGSWHEAEDTEEEWLSSILAASPLLARKKGAKRGTERISNHSADICSVHLYAWTT